jgi:hypothetical protein
MKLIFSALLLISFTAHAADPMMSMKDRLRLHMWSFGLEETPVKQVKPQAKPLPEEIERALRKF